MLSFNGILCASRKLHPLLWEFSSNVKLTLLPLRTITYKNEVEGKKKSPVAELKPLSGFDDPTFTENLKVVLRNPRLFVKGFSNLGREIKRFWKEEFGDISNAQNLRVDERHDRIDILHKFENAEDLKGFEVRTDSSFSCGFSSASLQITGEETGLFSGQICEDPPKDGNVEFSGFATMFCAAEMRAFFRIKRRDFKMYTHLVLKIRGDGRTYLVLLNVPERFDESKHFKYAQPLYTRGGPYWQIVKMPLSHFFFMVKGAIPSAGHSTKLAMSRITRMGITAAGFGGPFKLEIDYIGLTYDKFHKTTSPYEEYRL